MAAIGRAGKGVAEVNLSVLIQPPKIYRPIDQGDEDAAADDVADCHRDKVRHGPCERHPFGYLQHGDRKEILV